MESKKYPKQPPIKVTQVTTLAEVSTIQAAFDAISVMFSGIPLEGAHEVVRYEFFFNSNGYLFEVAVTPEPDPTSVPNTLGEMYHGSVKVK